MEKRIDARGLSCPQPLFLTQEALWKVKTGVVEVLVDDATALQNIKRVAEKEGWGFEVKPIEHDECLLILSKK